MIKLPDITLQWPITWDGVKLIAESESCRLTSYQCSAGRWTIGWGETSGITQGMKWSQAQADKTFCASLTTFTNGVRALLTGMTDDAQISAMVSLAYNIGLAAFKTSTVLRMHNQGKTVEAANAFSMFNKVRKNGALVVEPGLVIRRSKEAVVYLSGTSTVVNKDQEPLPDADEKCDVPLMKSSSAQSGAAVAAAGVTAGAAEVINELAPAISTIQVVMKWSIPVLIIVAIVAGSIVMYRAWKRRQDGTT